MFVGVGCTPWLGHSKHGISETMLFWSVSLVAFPSSCISYGWQRSRDKVDTGVL